MGWRLRAWAAVFLGIFLPLPLVGLLCFMLLTGPSSVSTDRGPALIPMLSLKERMGTLTYQRECETDRDCDPRLRCLLSMVTSYSYCVDSRCMADKHCPPGFSCQTQLADNGVDLINACELIGQAKEGGVCNSFANEPQYSCEQGLVCRERCGRPCTPGDPASCPKGFFCEKDITGASCQPTCDGRTCPQGQRCVDLGRRRSVCAKVNGRDCQLEACAPGTKCMVSDYPQPADEVWMRCVQRCNLKGAAPCPEGSLCVVHGCRPTCTPGDPTTCLAGYRCESRPGLTAAICSPDVPKGEATP